MTDHECRQLLDLAEKATDSGKWHTEGECLFADRYRMLAQFWTYSQGRTEAQAIADNNYASAAANAVPGLIEDRRRLMASLEKLLGPLCDKEGRTIHCHGIYQAEPIQTAAALLRDMRGKEQA